MICLALVFCAISGAYAQERIYDGCYVPEAGSVMTKSTSESTHHGGVFSKTHTDWLGRAFRL
jgi:hypothetical protein